MHKHSRVARETDWDQNHCCCPTSTFSFILQEQNPQVSAVHRAIQTGNLLTGKWDHILNSEQWYMSGETCSTEDYALKRKWCILLSISSSGCSKYQHCDEPFAIVQIKATPATPLKPQVPWSFSFPQEIQIRTQDQERLMTRTPNL